MVVKQSGWDGALVVFGPGNAVETNDTDLKSTDDTLRLYFGEWP